MSVSILTGKMNLSEFWQLRLKSLNELLCEWFLTETKSIACLNAVWMYLDEPQDLLRLGLTVNEPSKSVYEFYLSMNEPHHNVTEFKWVLKLSNKL